MQDLFIFSFFLLGTIVASFVGVIAGRLNTGQSIVVGRSRCDACGESLSPLTLVPIVSYIASKGRAFCCGVRLSPLLPISELVLGGLFSGTYVMLGISLALPCFLFSLSMLLALVLYDLEHQILPPSLLTLFVLGSAITGYLLAPSQEAMTTSLLTALGVAGVLALIHLLSRGRAMGFSDAPLAFGLALLVGSAAISGFVYSFWIGAVVGIILLLRRPRGSRIGVEVPFAPFLACGFLLAYFTQWNLFALALALSTIAL